jgi:signal transduction histidine kinase
VSTINAAPPKRRRFQRPWQPWQARWSDLSLAAGATLILEIEAITSVHRQGPLALSVVLVAVMSLTAIWRRKAPLAFLITVGVASGALHAGLTSTSTSYSTLAGLYTVLIPTYAVGAWERRPRAIVGVLIFFVGALAGTAAWHTSAGTVTPAVLTGIAAWTAGRVVRAHRALTDDLELKLAQLTAGRVELRRLAISNERMRIARDLHEVVARNVVGMVLEAEAAQRFLDKEETSADIALSIVETTGRVALVEIRRVLGVLRRLDGPRELEPHPRLSQLDDLVRRHRDSGRLVDLRVTGDVQTLPTGVDFALYRIAEEALETISTNEYEECAVTVNVAEDCANLHILVRCRGQLAWPTAVMREWTALCTGNIDATLECGVWYLTVFLPISPRTSSI